MHSRERVVVYGLLIASLAASALSMLVVSSPQALAQTPSTGVPSIALSGEKGDLIVKNTGGRIAWADNDFSKAYSIAFVHIGKVLKQMTDSEANKEEMEALRKELEEAEAKYRTQLEEISGRLRGVEEGSEEFKRIYEEGDKLFTEYRGWAGTAAERRSKLEVSHFEKAYRQLVEAVEVVSERKGIDLVYRFIATSEPFEATDAEQALTEIRLRSVIKYPQGLDITPDVLKELSLKDE